MRFTREETIKLEVGSSAIIQKSLPLKSNHSITIVVLLMEKALLDLEASINLMSLTLRKMIGDLEVKPTRIKLQLVDRSFKYPYGMVEDVLVKVDIFMFPVDFFVMDIEEDNEVPLIPFMKTVRVIIDVEVGKLKLRSHHDEMTFNVFEVLHVEPSVFKL